MDDMARSPHLGFVSSFAKTTLMVPAERSFSLPEIVAVHGNALGLRQLARAASRAKRARRSSRMQRDMGDDMMDEDVAWGRGSDDAFGDTGVRSSDHPGQRISQKWVS